MEYKTQQNINQPKRFLHSSIFNEQIRPFSIRNVSVFGLCGNIRNNYHSVFHFAFYHHFRIHLLNGISAFEHPSSSIHWIISKRAITNISYEFLYRLLWINLLNVYSIWEVLLNPAIVRFRNFPHILSSFFFFLFHQIILNEIHSFCKNLMKMCTSGYFIHWQRSSLHYCLMWNIKFKYRNNT